MEQRLSRGGLAQSSAARPEILRIGARRMCGMGKQPDCEDAQCQTREYEYPFHFLAYRRSPLTPARGEASTVG